MLDSQSTLPTALFITIKDAHPIQLNFALGSMCSIAHSLIKRKRWTSRNTLNPIPERLLPISDYYKKRFALWATRGTAISISGRSVPGVVPSRNEDGQVLFNVSLRPLGYAWHGHFYIRAKRARRSSVAERRRAGFIQCFASPFGLRDPPKSSCPIFLEGRAPRARIAPWCKA